MTGVAELHDGPLWCNPPRHGVWVNLLEPVMKRPGVWALVRSDYRRAELAQQAVRDLRSAARGDVVIRTGRARAVIPPGRWEFQSGQIGRNEVGWGVWARWLGP